jgi:short subunit dehydrogenase-like uncharacterized protein
VPGSTQFDINVFGATGYVGRFDVAHLARNLPFLCRVVMGSGG